MQKSVCMRFLGEAVSVGVPHKYEPRPFYYYGIIKEVTDKYLVLSYPGGVRQICLCDVIDLRLNKDNRRKEEEP